MRMIFLSPADGSISTARRCRPRISYEQEGECRMNATDGLTRDLVERFGRAGEALADDAA
jgi:hypothetical protein